MPGRGIGEGGERGAPALHVASPFYPWPPPDPSAAYALSRGVADGRKEDDIRQAVSASDATAASTASVASVAAATAASAASAAATAAIAATVAAAALSPLFDEC